VNLPPTKESKAAIHWINALLTTEEKQATGMLGNSKNGYCCLGLGCKVLEVPYDEEDTDSSALRCKVTLRSNIGDPKDGLPALTTLNDECHFSFKEIAVRLITMPEQYFMPRVATRIKEHFTKHPAKIG